MGRAETWDATEAAQKALSCVYRSGQRFGVNHVIDVLRGSESERIRQCGHDHLTTYGIGKDLDATTWRSVFRQLVACGLLEVEAEFGSLRLTEGSRAVLRGERRLQLRKEQRERRERDRSPRSGVPDTHALGVPMRDIQALGKRIGRQPALMQPLWDSGIYEARLLVAFIADPAQVTSAQMDRWCRQFDNWAVCDTLCLHLFDRSPHAWGRIDAWARKRGEFEKRAAFALLAPARWLQPTTPQCGRRPLGLGSFLPCPYPARRKLR